MNPILPIQHFVPDVEARQWNDGRIYLYGSYDYIDFDAQPVQSFQAPAASLSYGGLIEIHLDQPDGEIIATGEDTRTGGWQKWAAFTCPVRDAKGVRAVYLVFKGKEGMLSEQARKFDPERLFDLESFWFAEK